MKTAGEGLRTVSRQRGFQERQASLGESCPSLTDEMTGTLIAKGGPFASTSQREMLARRIDGPGRVKMRNESVLENLDVMQHAMRVRHQVRLQ